MITRLYRFHLIAAIVIFLTALKWGSSYTYSDIKDILSTLQNISAMIFTIAGIWLAYIYPKAIGVMIKPSTLIEQKESETIDEKITPEFKLSQDQKNVMLKDINRITMIVDAIIVSALVIFAIIIINVVKPIFIHIDFVRSNIEIYSSIGCFITLILVYFQIISLLSIIISNVVFINDIHNEKNKTELDELK